MQTMALYYIPCLVRSDRYFIARLESGENHPPEFNFVIFAEDRVLTPVLTIEDPRKLVLNQMAPGSLQDIPLEECHLSLQKNAGGFELIIRKSNGFAVEAYNDEESGLRMDFSEELKRITIGVYKYRVTAHSFSLTITLVDGQQSFSGKWDVSLVRSEDCHRVVIDFGSEASQIGYKNCGAQLAVQQYDILENIMSRLRFSDKQAVYRRENFLNHEPGQPMLYRSFYAVRKKIEPGAAEQFPFNFTDDIAGDEIRMFITRQEVAATEQAFRDGYEIIPNLKLGIEKSLQLTIGDRTEDYNMQSHKKELIAAVLLRLLRLMISTKSVFRKGGLIVTLLVPNIYTQQDVFELLNELRKRTAALLASMAIPGNHLPIEYETISESDAAFMGYQQTHGDEAALSNGEIALVIDCGKGTTDISMLLADENENYSSFFRTGFAGAGNVLLYGFAEDFLTLVLKAIPGSNEISVRDFISRYILRQDLTAEVLDFIQLMENQKKKFGSLQPVSLSEFSRLAEDTISTERTIGNLHKDLSTLLVYADNILRDRRIRWDEELTGLIDKAADCICHSIIASIRDVITRDVRKRIRIVMLSGRAFYLDILKQKVERALGELLGKGIQVKTVPAGRTLNNKNVAIYGAFSGAYKITDFTGIPIDRKSGLSQNRDVLNNNNFLYRGIKIEPGNDILYNASVVRRNNQELKAFRNKTVDIYFTRDNIYLRLMENQRVKDVRSLYSVLNAIAETNSPVQDMKSISLFPSGKTELASIETLFQDMVKHSTVPVSRTVKKKKGILAFFQF